MTRSPNPPLQQTGRTSLQRTRASTACGRQLSGRVFRQPGQVHAGGAISWCFALLCAFSGIGCNGAATVDSREARSHLRMLVASVMMFCAMGCADSSRVAEGSRVETLSMFDDGMRLMLTPDSNQDAYCAGANVRWVEDAVYIALVNAKHGSEVGSSNPSSINGSGRRFIFVPEGHVAPGAWVTVYLDEGSGFRKFGGHQRAAAPPVIPDGSSGAR